MKEKSLRSLSSKIIVISLINHPRLTIFMHWNNGKELKGDVTKFKLTLKTFKDNLYSIQSDASNPVMDHSP